jgi:hypothetical protein
MRLLWKLIQIHYKLIKLLEITFNAYKWQVNLLLMKIMSKMLNKN